MALVIFGRNIKLARTWDELTEIQLQEIAAALEHFQKFKDCHPVDFLPAIFSRLYVSLVKNLLRTNNPVKTYIALKQLPPDEYQENVQFLLKGNQRTVFPKAIRAACLKKTIFHPPGPRLNNIVVKEFSFADAMFYRWRELQDDRYLDLLCAVLYREAGGEKETDIRKEFQNELVDKNLHLWKKVRRKRKLAIAYAYEGSRNYMAGRHLNVFPPAPKPSEEEKLKPRPKAKYVPFGKLISAKAEYKPHQLAAVENLNLYKFLGLFDNELSENQKSKK